MAEEIGMLAGLGRNVTGVWQDWNTKKRIMVISSIVISLLVFIGLLCYFTKPVYTPLYSGLAPQDAGQITAKLKEMGVPYRLKDDGSAILVSADKVYEIRIELASLDIPRSGITGFELFDVSKLGATDFERQVNYKRALEGELTRSILKIEGVESARVHIVLPEKSLFIKDERKPTASVLLGLFPYTEMTSRQINGIINLVANSVEGLAKEDVTVIDTRGNVLSDMFSDVTALSDSQKFMTQIKAEQQYEQELQLRIQTMLEQVYGFGKVVTRVKAELDFDQIEKIEESYYPVSGTEGIVLREEVYTESYRGTGANSDSRGGNTDSIDAPTYEWNLTGDGEYERDERITEYGVNKSQQIHVVTPGSVNRLSVVVWIDGELTDNQRSDIENAVASTVGYNQARGDTIHVASATFNGVDLITDFQAMPGPTSMSRMFIPAVIAGIAALALLLFAYLAFVRKTRKQYRTIQDGLKEMATGMEGAMSLLRDVSPQEKEFEELIKQLKKWTEEKPMEMVQLIRMWANEDR